MTSQFGTEKLVLHAHPTLTTTLILRLALFAPKAFPTTKLKELAPSQLD
jgi:hypothetical protein